MTAPSAEAVALADEIEAATGTRPPDTSHPFAGVSRDDFARAVDGSFLSRSTFARFVGVAPSTVSRWMARPAAVTPYNALRVVAVIADPYLSMPGAGGEPAGGSERARAAALRRLFGTDRATGTDLTRLSDATAGAVMALRPADLAAVARIIRALILATPGDNAARNLKALDDAMRG